MTSVIAGLWFYTSDCQAVLYQKRVYGSHTHEETLKCITYIFSHYECDSALQNLLSRNELM